MSSNYLPACKTDNLSKSDKWVYDWLFDATVRPDELKPVHYQTWDAVFLYQLFHEIQHDHDS